MSKTIKENDLGDRMYTGQSYVQGGLGGASSLDTFNSPDVSQNPNSFKYAPSIAGSASDISTPPPEDYDNKSTYDPGQYEKDVQDIKYKVTPDEVLAGLQYELKKMVFKRKDLAKELVVRNLKEDNKYYSKLHMLNIDDDDKLPVKPSFMSPESKAEPYNLMATPQQEAVDYRTPQEKEIGKIIREMAQKKYEKELSIGVQVEMEHTNDEKIATEIAMDHLTEDPEYYSKLVNAGLAKEFSPSTNSGLGDPNQSFNDAPRIGNNSVSSNNMGGNIGHTPNGKVEGRRSEPVHDDTVEIDIEEPSLNEAKTKKKKKKGAKPTNSKLWSRAKSLARSKFDVYPSAYANAWAAKWYKSKGGGWR